MTRFIIQWENKQKPTVHSKSMANDVIVIFSKSIQMHFVAAKERFLKVFENQMKRWSSACRGGGYGFNRRRAGTFSDDVNY